MDDASEVDEEDKDRLNGRSRRLRKKDEEEDEKRLKRGLAALVQFLDQRGLPSVNNEMLAISSARAANFFQGVQLCYGKTS